MISIEIKHRGAVGGGLAAAVRPGRGRSVQPGRGQGGGDHTLPPCGGATFAAG